MFTCFLSTSPSSPLFAGFTHGKIPKTTSGWSSTACCSFCKHLAWTFGRPDRAVNAVNVWNPVPQKPWEVSLKTSTGWQECYRICQCLVSGLNWQPTFRCACVGLEAVSFSWHQVFWDILSQATGWHDNPTISEEWRWIPRFQVLSIYAAYMQHMLLVFGAGKIWKSRAKRFHQTGSVEPAISHHAASRTNQRLTVWHIWLDSPKKYRIYRSFGVHASKTSMGGKKWKKSLNYSTTNFRNFLGTYVCKRVKHIHTCKNNPKDNFLWNSHSAHFWVSTHVEGGTHYCHFHVFSRDARLDVPIS